MLRVCIVDDHPLVRDALALSLHSVGFEVSTAEDAETALSCIEASAPHVVLVDLQQPGSEDASIVARLCAAFPALPIVAMSGDFSLEAKARNLGAVDFVSKPFRAEVLAPRLRAFAQTSMPAAA